VYFIEFIQDYLVVECVDGSVAVWELGTGHLEGILFGQVARDISESSDTVSFFEFQEIWEF
jgi:hypothetical protein